MRQQTVSLCIPTHGRPTYLLEALESGLAQTRLPDEIVVSDDLGHSETRALVEAFAPRAPFPVRYVLCTENPGQAWNVNNLIKEANGDLILLLHDDDVLMPRAIELLEPPFRVSESVVGTFGKQIVITDTGQELIEESKGLNDSFRRNALYVGQQPDALVSAIWQQFPNDGFIVRSSVARDTLYRPESRAGCDLDFGIRLSQRGAFYFIDEYTAKYRLSAHSIARGRESRSDDCAYQGMHIFLGLLDSHPGYTDELAKKLRTISPVGIGMAINMGKLDEAKAWYFGPYHRHRILSLGGIRRGLRLARAWFLRASFRSRASCN